MSLNSMFSFLSLLLSLILVVNKFETTFVTLGDYDIPKHGINSRDCGLIYEPKVIQIVFNDNCFAKKHPNITYIDYTDYIDYKPTLTSVNQLIKSRIFNGEKAGLTEAPWAVFIRDRGLFGIESKICTGVLIGWQWVLTAAHCRKSSSLNTLEIYAGSNKLRQGEMIEGAKFYSHPRFKKKPDLDLREEALYKEYDFDIALIKLKTKFTQKTFGTQFQINTICLPKRSTTMNERPGERATSFGWGYTEVDKAPDNLMKGVFVLEPFDKCYNLLLCSMHNATYTGPKTCPGDSGGPLVQFVKKNESSRAILIGTLVGGTPATGCANYIDSLWMPTPKVIDWILDIIKSN